MTIRNLDEETALAVRRHAAASGRTLAEELRFLAGNAGIAEKAAVNDSAQPEDREERELTGAEKLAIVREIRAKQTKVWPSCVPLIRQVRREQAAHAEAKCGIPPMKKTATRDARKTPAPRARKRK